MPLRRTRRQRKRNKKQEREQMGKPNRRAIPPPPIRNKSDMQHPTTRTPPSFMETMIQGFSFGSGSALAHQFVHSLLGPTKTTSPTPSSPTTTEKTRDTELSIPPQCLFLKDIYTDCLQENTQNHQACKQLQNDLTACVQEAT